MDKNTADQIEETLAHQDLQIQDLSDVIIAQSKDIERLRLDIQKLENKVRELEVTPNHSEGEELSLLEQAERDRPPHY